MHAIKNLLQINILFYRFVRKIELSLCVCKTKQEK